MSLVRRRDAGLTLKKDIFTAQFQGGASFVDHLCYFCLVFVMLCARLFVGAFWLPAGKGLISWLSFSIGILGHVWCLIVPIPDLCPLSYLNKQPPGQSSTTNPILY